MATREVQRARVTAIVFGTLSVITLIALVFAFIQQGLAKRSVTIAGEQALIAKQITERSLECERSAKEMQLQAEQQFRECQRRSEALEQELYKIKKR
jgi:hypothetical protein